MIGNLLPCCGNCNEKKGNKDWEAFLKQKGNSNKKIRILKKYFKKYLPAKINPEKLCPRESKQLDNIKSKIFKLFKKADKIAVKVKGKITKH